MISVVFEIWTARDLDTRHEDKTPGWMKHSTLFIVVGLRAANNMVILDNVEKTNHSIKSMDRTKVRRIINPCGGLNNVMGIIVLDLHAKKSDHSDKMKTFQPTLFFARNCAPVSPVTSTRSSS